MSFHQITNVHISPTKNNIFYDVKRNYTYATSFYWQFIRLVTSILSQKIFHLHLSFSICIHFTIPYASEPLIRLEYTFRFPVRNLSSFVCSFDVPFDLLTGTSGMLHPLKPRRRARNTTTP